MIFTMSLEIRRRAVRAPGGEEWRVGRRWITRSLPRWRKVRVGGAANDAAWWIPDFGNLEDLGLAVMVAVGALVFAVILIPLIFFGVELIIVGLAIAAGILGRGLLGRPWVVEAVMDEEPHRTLGWRVVGLKRSARVIEEVALALQSGLEPSPGEAAEPCARELAGAT